MRFKFNTLLYVAALLFFLVSLPGLYVDVINPDGINWHTRSSNFVTSLSKHHFSDTYQTYHPGITLMWLSGPPLHILDTYLTSMGFLSYGRDTFLIYDYVAKLCIVVSATFLFLISILILSKYLTPISLLFFCLFYIFEPYVVGQRRLYHLDYLMAHLLFVSFLFFFNYFIGKGKFLNLVAGCLFLALGLLTKTTAIVFLVVPFLMIFGSHINLTKKIIGFFAIASFTAVFIYIFFPAIWTKPIKSFPKYVNKMMTGVEDIGIDNKKEIGFAGSRSNITLDEEKGDTPSDFYINAVAFRLSFAFFIILALSLCLLIIRALTLLKDELSNLYNFFKGTFKHKDSVISDNVWLSAFSIITIQIFFIVLSIATKKSERYAIIFIPFLFLAVSQGLGCIKKSSGLVLSSVFLLSLIPQYIQIYPYFHSYGSPVLGGVSSKYAKLDSSAFGVATYDVYKSIVDDSKGTKQTPTVSGYKSLKKIAYGLSFNRFPNCDSNYYVNFYYDKNPREVCGDHYALIKTVTVGNMDYWYIYRNTVVSTVDTTEETED